MKKTLLIVLAVVVIICAGLGAYAVAKDNNDDYMPPRNLFNYFSTLYIWNEDKDSAPEGVRYALLENSETEIPLDEIFGKGTADLSELSETLRSVYDYGLKICEIYSYDGYKVPEGAAE